MGNKSSHAIFTLMRARLTSDLFDLSKELKVPMAVFASACEAVALSVRMTSLPEVVAVLDIEYDALKKKMQQEIKSAEFQKAIQLPSSSISFDSSENRVRGRKIIDDIFSRPLILDDDDKEDKK